jgi:hypothetical protein
MASAKATHDAAVRRVAELELVLRSGGWAAQEAFLHIVDARRDVTVTDIAFQKSAHEHSEVVEAVTEQTRALLHVEHRRLVTRVKRALDKAQPEVDALKAFEALRQDVLGPSDALCQERYATAWNSLSSGTPEFEPLLAHWSRMVHEVGLLDDVT